MSKTQLFKVIQSRGLLGRILGALMKLVLSLMKNLLPPLRKGLLISIGLTSTSSATDAGIN